MTAGRRFDWQSNPTHLTIRLPIESTMKPFPFAFVLLSSFAAAAVIESDICVYGGTSGGVAAAVQVARMGKSVVIAESGRHLGGMTSGGLSAVDIGDPRSVGGIAREYFTKLAATVSFPLSFTPSFPFSSSLLPFSPSLLFPSLS
ncbi:MAG TPA: FAD-dependent oxidoreductase, partial [Prosthecobacter sp.]|nr:FAD-dependent oxidoreductase [Prosthecobacter sp.]